MIYAVNNRTKEHRLYERGDECEPEKWAIVNATPDGWIEWRAAPGKESPMPRGAVCDIRHRDGEEFDACLAEIEEWDDCCGGPTDIIAYRPILAAEPCRFHDHDIEACETYSGQVPCEPEPSEWEGEGLPPINHTCEMARAGEKHAPGSLRYIGDNLVVWQFENGVEIALRPEHCDFRPIRSEEDKAVDAMLSVVHGDGHLSEPGARALYRAGYRK